MCVYVFVCVCVCVCRQLLSMTSKCMQISNFTNDKRLEASCCSLACEVRRSFLPPPICHTIYASCHLNMYMCVSVSGTNPANAQMRMCTHSMLIFLLPQQIRFLCTNQTENIKQMANGECEKERQRQYAKL